MSLDIASHLGRTNMSLQPDGPAHDELVPSLRAAGRRDVVVVRSQPRF